MYNIGTVTTTANSNKLVGTGTKWKENINGIQPQQVIQIVVGGIVYNSSIQSIESDTALTLNFPFHAAVKDAKYVILTTMVNSVSSAANYMVALNTSNMQARDVANAFMTLEGTVSMTAPDGTKVNLRTAKEMDKQLDGKLDKKGGELTGSISLPSVTLTRKIGDQLNLYAPQSDDSLAFFQYNTIGGSWHGRVEIPKASAGSTTKLMQVGDYGWGSIGGGTAGSWDPAAVIENFRTGVSRIWRTEVGGSDHVYRYAPNILFKAGDTFTNISTDIYTGITKITSGISANATSYKSNTLWGSSNTTKDANGNLKAASPVIKVFADHIENNDESEGVTLKKLHTGIYQLHGVLGLHSDASWGGINGGITIPCGINQLPLVYALYDVLGKGKPHPFDGRIVEPDEDGILFYTLPIASMIYHKTYSMSASNFTLNS